MVRVSKCLIMLNIYFPMTGKYLISLGLLKSKSKALFRTPSALAFKCFEKRGVDGQLSFEESDLESVVVEADFVDGYDIAE